MGSGRAICPPVLPPADSPGNLALSPVCALLDRRISRIVNLPARWGCVIPLVLAPPGSDIGSRKVRSP
jgi:hypothetical protein